MEAFDMVILSGVPRKKRLRVLVEITLALVVIGIIALVVIYFTLVLPMRRTSRKLFRAGWVAYVTRGCGYCDKQLNTCPQFPGFVRCPDAARAAECAAVPAFPFWRNTRTGETRVGYQDDAALRAMAK
jgi:hypothetical protein